MADTKPIKSLPVRVQFTLNPVAHPDAIKLLSSLAQSDLAGAVADLVTEGFAQAVKVVREQDYQPVRPRYL